MTAPVPQAAFTERPTLQKKVEIMALLWNCAAGHQSVGASISALHAHVKLDTWFENVHLGFF